MCQDRERTESGKELFSDLEVAGRDWVYGTDDSGDLVSRVLQDIGNSGGDVKLFFFGDYQYFQFTSLSNLLILNRELIVTIFYQTNPF